MKSHSPPPARERRCEALERRTLLAVQLVADLNPATLGSEPAGFVSAGSSAYFFALTPGNGVGLWRTDGTAGGTSAVRHNLAPNSFPSNPALAGTRLYFGNQDTTRGRELWTSDGEDKGDILGTF